MGRGFRERRKEVEERRRTEKGKIKGRRKKETRRWVGQGTYSMGLRVLAERKREEHGGKGGGWRRGEEGEVK